MGGIKYSTSQRQIRNSSRGKGKKNAEEEQKEVGKAVNTEKRRGNRMIEDKTKNQKGR